MALLCPASLTIAGLGRTALGASSVTLRSKSQYSSRSAIHRIRVRANLVISSDTTITVQDARCRVSAGCEPGRPDSEGSESVDAGNWCRQRRHIAPLSRSEDLGSNQPLASLLHTQLRVAQRLGQSAALRWRPRRSPQDSEHCRRRPVPSRACQSTPVARQCCEVIRPSDYHPKKESSNHGRCTERGPCRGDRPKRCHPAEGTLSADLLTGGILWVDRAAKHVVVGTSRSALGDSVAKRQLH